MNATPLLVSRAPHPVTRLGLVVPGLGHLLVGEWITGLGLLMLDALLVWAALAIPRLPRILFSGPADGLLIHPIVALGSWVGLAVGLWWVALRRAYPRRKAVDARQTDLDSLVRVFRRHRTGRLGLFGVLGMVGLTLLTPLLAPYDPLAVGVGAELLPPGPAHWMGTDEFGRDVFSRLLYGGRISLAIGFVAVGLSATLGTSLGAAAGYFGGWFDRIVMFVVDLLLSFPRLVLLLTVVGLFRVGGSGGILLVIVILGLTAWMGIARIVRSEVLGLREREFVQAATALGLSRGRILVRHLVPNTLPLVIVYCSLTIGGTMLAEASLSFLGLGVPPPTATWGVLVSDGRDPLRTAPWISLFPGLAIMISVLCFNLLGDGVRDALDPKLRH